MPSVAELARPLLESLDRYCKDHSAECPLGNCVEHPETIDQRTALHVVSPDDAAARELLRDSRCQQCTLVLTLRAIERNVPMLRLEKWLNEPHVDLQGRTPRACLDAGHFDPVINALWLLDQSELTCG